MVADPGEVFHPAAPDQDDGVLLKVVAFPADVGGNLDAIGEADPGDLA
jgi:hypothetical protein